MREHLKRRYKSHVALWRDDVRGHCSMMTSGNPTSSQEKPMSYQRLDIPTTLVFDEGGRARASQTWTTFAGGYRWRLRNNTVTRSDALQLSPVIVK